MKKFYRAQVLITDKGQQFLDSITLPPSPGGKPHIIQELVIPKVPHYEPKMGITKLTQFDSLLDSNYADLEVEILTGRTHQIRYHLSRHGLPVRGDYLYMDKKDLDENDIMHLQAYRLQFLDIEGELIDVECEKSW